MKSRRRSHSAARPRQIIEAVRAAVFATVLVSAVQAPAIGSDVKAHLETVPIEESHPETAPEIKVKSGAEHVQLQGEIQKDQWMAVVNAKLGFTVKPDGKDALPGSVTKVESSSPLTKRGIVVGDKLLSEVKNDDGSLTLTMEHAGQGMRFTISLNELAAAAQKVAMAAATQNLATGASTQKISTGISKPAPSSQPLVSSTQKRKREFKSIVDVLEDHDLGLIIDRSGSMTTQDCPGGLSRWDWCCMEATELAQAAAQAASSIDASIFNTMYLTYQHIKPSQIPEIFSINRPGGGTEPAYAIEEQMENYFNGGRKKPLTIVVVTDGLPNHPQNVAQILRDESRKIKYQGELTITFLLIGDEVDVPRLRHFLGLSEKSSVVDGGFVDILPFSQLATKGVKRALFEDLKEVRLATDPSKPSHAAETALGPQAPGNVTNVPNYGYGAGIKVYGKSAASHGVRNYQTSTP